MKTCPYCAEQIEDQVTRCPYCQNDLGQPPAQVPLPAQTPPPVVQVPPPAPYQPIAPYQPSPPGPPTVPGPPAVVGEGALRFSHSGERYILGYGQDFFGIWDRTVPGPAVLRFPRTDQGWAEAWGQFVAREPRSMAVPAVGVPQSTPTVAFRDAHVLAVSVIWLLISMAVVQLVIAILALFMIGHLQDDVGFAVEDTADRIQAAAFLWVLLAIGAIVFWCIWQFRAQRNVRAFGANGLRITPGWAVGWWFIPIANLFMPYQAMSELMRASSSTTGPDAWQHVPTSPLLPLWWGFLILGNVISRIVTTVMDSPSWTRTSPGAGATIAWLSVGLIVLSVAAVLAVLVVREVDRRQGERRRTGDQAVPSAL